MTEKAIALEINCATGETIERPLTTAELANRDQINAQIQSERAEREAAEAAKADAKLSAQAKLAALGLTGEEVAAITE